MKVQNIHCSLICYSSQKTQSSCSRNFRITNIVVGILLTAAGIGLFCGIGVIGWAFIAVGVLAFNVGIFFVCNKKPSPEVSANDHQKSSPVKIIDPNQEKNCTSGKESAAPTKKTVQVKKLSPQDEQATNLLNDIWKFIKANPDINAKNIQGLKKTLASYYTQFQGIIDRKDIDQDILTNIGMAISIYNTEIKRVENELKNY